MSGEICIYKNKTYLKSVKRKGLADMTDNVIITIGRQFGSGGHEIGNKLATRLDIPLYDHNLVKMAARELHLDDDVAKEADETMLGKFLSAYVVGVGSYTAFMNGEELVEPVSDRLYTQQTEILKKLAKRSSCVIVGRCADYILGDYTNYLHAFIHASMDDRIRRIMRIYELNEKQAKDKIKKVDRERKLYYEAHTGRKWGDIDSYQMMFNSSLLGVDGIVDILEAAYRQKVK